MAQGPLVERSNSGGGMASGVIVGIVAVVAVVLVVALFMVLGGNSRFAQAPAVAPNTTTNVTVPAQQPVPVAPQINVPRTIDINVNQPAAQPATP